MIRRPATLLFCPGHRPERFDKAWRGGAGGVVLDLEDGVGAADKSRAREAVFSWLAQNATQADSAAPLVTLRINEPQNAQGLEDIYTLMHAPALPESGWLLVPKVEDAGELAWVAAHLARRLPKWHLCGLIESGRGMRALTRIAQQPLLAALAYGGADLRADLGLAESFESQLYARSRFVLDASGHGLHLMDVPHLDLDAPDALREECERVRGLGFRGKLAIHPRQVPVIAQAFAPTAEAVAAARRVIAAYQAAGGNAVQMDGRMVDEPIYQQALATVAAHIPT